MQFPDVIGEGDQLLITVFGQPDMSADVLVGASGIITLPLVGVIEVKGKTASEVAMQFARKLEQGQYLLDPKVSVKVVQQISRSFSVLGEVLRPGRYPLQGPVSMLEALSLAGGTTTRADKSLRVLRRKLSASATAPQEVLSLKLDLEEGKNQTALMQSVLPNDVLIIGQQKNFYVYGEVRRPGMYPVETELNIMRVLAIGGGVTDRGSTSRMLIYRKSDSGNIQAVPATLTDPVLPGDVVFVNERIF
ncbi:polysaccharide biosynthesis/export family protein [Undibacterium oligocarboniphilum]|uniref:SLBB domain-containing protein n=1 Tax=Undibacterium oligocarboniphilum TaxID=666702 RepID=A0A850QGI1_9BURK|nr:polysaccharide biosynthesis/export family protein [Undibacterium oligocarboniphilum]MBC3870106.1 SLBB domain-containing protein [Undibacterium oligocarboniphilum]NVO78097.1 SLBB domain-containing protein [Undibacterium oligocarboniphilum]